MPTLKLVHSEPPKKKKEEDENIHIRAGQPHHPAEQDDDHDDDADRFSQTPSMLSSAAAVAAEESSTIVTYYSIANAIQNHKNSHKQKVGGTAASWRNSMESSSATDIVAVVLSTAIHQAPPPPSSLISSSTAKTPKRGTNYGNSTRIHLLIGDPSLPRIGQCARVTMNTTSSSLSNQFSIRLATLLGVDGMGSGTASNTATFASPSKTSVQPTGIRLGQLQPGDIVRFNKLEVRSDYSDDSPNKHKRKLSDDSDRGNATSDNNHHHSLLSVVCDLSASWRDPVAGPPLARLCRIIPKPSSHGADKKQPPSTSAMQQEHHPETMEDFELEWETFIPPSMETPDDIVMKLARWYCINARPHFAQSTAILPTNQPCIRRKLREIAVPNMLSHVVVRILRCEKAISKWATPSKSTSNNPVVTHVTLSDGAESDDLLGMTGNTINNHGQLPTLPKSISSVLLQSMKEGSRVLLTHVLSRNANPASGAASLPGRELLVIVPTRESTVVLLTPDHPYYVSLEEDYPLFASQPLDLEGSAKTMAHDDQRRVETVVASLKDVIVDGIDASFLEGKYWQSLYKLSSFLTESQSITTGLSAIKLSPSYRSATLMLDPKCVPSSIVINANGDAMKLLCMDVPVEDMVINADDPTGVDNPYLRHVGEMLRALCTEDILIRWVLEQESQSSWFVTDATLVEV